MPKEEQIFISNHALQRYLERSVFKQFNQNKINELVQNILSNKEEKDKYTSELIQRIKEEAEEERWLFNNSEFTSHLYQRYGYENISTFYMDAELIYIMAKKGKAFLVKTCIPLQQFHITRNRKRKVKFSSKPVTEQYTNGELNHVNAISKKLEWERK